jgi:hypothetical protein
MLIMIAPAIDEVVAMGQFLVGAKREGKPLWRTFWIGGTLDQYGNTAVTELAETPHTRSIAARIIGAMDLNHVPWNLLVSAALGVWLMAAPAVLGSTSAAADSDHLTGALIVTWAVIAFGEVTRPARLLNIPLGLWIMLAPWIMIGDTEASRWNDAIAGAAIVALTLRRGAIKERFGGWNRYLA